jgi:FtsZ-interacting cell division protein ZipA
MQKFKDILIIMACSAIVLLLGVHFWERIKLMGIRFPSLKSKEKDDEYVIKTESNAAETPKAADEPVEKKAETPVTEAKEAVEKPDISEQDKALLEKVTEALTSDISENADTSIQDNVLKSTINDLITLPSTPSVSEPNIAQIAAESTTQINNGNNNGV